MRQRLDRKISIFKLTENEDGIRTKVSVATNIRASFRQLSDDERVSTHENGTDSTVQFVINRRNVSTDMFVLYKRKTFGDSVYQVTSIDPFDDHDSTITLKCKLVEHQLDYEKEA